ncbi:MAG: 50S ribosomal protein L25/general stress protein Ctc [Cyclobacteriaceae bacterium]|nr:50S ribosomal protein L25/general stress protein Ctc [Cyclobacteriaceae bacterium]
MRTVEIIGYKRANLGKSESKRLRETGHSPCVLYGGKDQVHFYSPMILFRDVVYRPEPAFVKLNIEGDVYHAIMQDIQFHPVNEIINHVDFLELSDDRMIKMSIPIKFEGTSPGVVQGGKLTTKLRSVTVKAYPKNMPEKITLDISALDLGKSLKVSNIKATDFEVLNNPRVTIATVEIPRVLKGTETEAAQ